MPWPKVSFTSSAKQIKYANENRKSEEFQIGQLVWLSTRYLMREGKPWNKLQPKWMGPFQVIKKISDNAVKLTPRTLVITFIRLSMSHASNHIEVKHHELEVKMKLLLRNQPTKSLRTYLTKISKSLLKMKKTTNEDIPQDYFLVGGL